MKEGEERLQKQYAHYQDEIERLKANRCAVADRCPMHAPCPRTRRGGLGAFARAQVVGRTPRVGAPPDSAGHHVRDACPLWLTLQTLCSSLVFFRLRRVPLRGGSKRGTTPTTPGAAEPKLSAPSAGFWAAAAAAAATSAPAPAPAAAPVNPLAVEYV